MNLSLAVTSLLSVLCLIEYFILERKCRQLATEKHPIVREDYADFKPLIIYYNRVGKCGSRSLLTVIKETSILNNFEFISEMPLYTRFEERDLIKNVTQYQVPLFYTLGYNPYKAVNSWLNRVRAFSRLSGLKVLIRSSVLWISRRWFIRATWPKSRFFDKVSAISINSTLILSLPSNTCFRPLYNLVCTVVASSIGFYKFTDGTQH